MNLAEHGTFLMFRMITRFDGGEHWISKVASCYLFGSY
jgi:hypothetical protein